MNSAKKSEVGNEAVGSRQKTKTLRTLRYNEDRMKSIETTTPNDSQGLQGPLCLLLNANCLRNLPGSDICLAHFF